MCFQTASRKLGIIMHAFILQVSARRKNETNNEMQKKCLTFF